MKTECQNRPVCIDLFCGLFGWGEAFAEAGYHVVGFDIEDQFENFGKPKPDNCELVLRDIRSLSGAELVKTYGIPACIVASPPCQNYSFMAMPWGRAKQMRKALLGLAEFPKCYKGPRTVAELNDLFNQCFRIQREVSQAAGHYVPMVVENVRGAQEWVGRSRHNFGSFHLWGDVPALMPIPAKRILKYGKVCLSPKEMERANNGEVVAHPHAKGEGNKTAGMNWSDPAGRGKPVVPIPGRKRGVSFTDAAGFVAMEGVKGIPHRGVGHWTHPAEHEGVKQGGTWCNPEDRKTSSAKFGSKSSARKRASAEIAKIPPALASWIARTFKPRGL